MDLPLLTQHSYTSHLHAGEAGSIESGVLTAGIASISKERKHDAKKIEYTNSRWEKVLSSAIATPYLSEDQAKHT